MMLVVLCSHSTKDTVITASFAIIFTKSKQLLTPVSDLPYKFLTSRLLVSLGTDKIDSLA